MSDQPWIDARPTDEVRLARVAFYFSLVPVLILFVTVVAAFANVAADILYPPVVFSPLFSLIGTSVGIVAYRRSKHEAALLAIIFGVIVLVITSVLWAAGFLN